MEVRSNRCLQSRHRTRTLQTKRHLVEYNSRRLTEPAAARSAHLLTDLRKYETPDDFLEKYNNYIKPMAKYTIQGGKINATPQLLTVLLTVARSAAGHDSWAGGSRERAAFAS